MKEIEKLLDKLIRFTKNNPYDDKSMELGGSYKAEILRRFGDKVKRIYELESENLSLRHDKAIVDNYVKELEAQVEKMKKAIDIRDRIME